MVQNSKRPQPETFTSEQSCRPRLISSRITKVLLTYVQYLKYITSEAEKMT